MIPSSQPIGPKDFPVTAAAHQALELERDRLRVEKGQEIPQRLRAAREHGDTSSNDEYFAILEDEAVVDARLARLDDILNRATVVDPAAPGDTIAIGSSVKLYDLRTGDTVDYAITGAHAPSGAGTVSAISPVGAALLGRSAGDVVRVQLPRGRARELEVLAITQLDGP